MERPTQSAESSPDETVPAVWWTTAGMFPAHVAPPTKPATRPVNGRRSFMFALGGLAAALVYGPAFTVLPSDRLGLDRLVATARAQPREPASGPSARPKCPDVAAEPPATPLLTLAGPTPLPEAPGVVRASPPPPKRLTRARRPGAPLDPFLRQAQRVERDLVARVCSSLVAPGETITVPIHHKPSDGTARTRSEAPTALERCVVAQVRKAKHWPTDTAKVRTFEYHVAGRPTR